MRLDEVGTVGLMTSDAEGGHIVLQEYVSLAGGMGFVTGQAAFSHRVMLELDFGNRFSHRLVAFKAEIVAPFYQVELIGRRMGIVALHA